MGVQVPSPAVSARRLFTVVVALGLLACSATTPNTSAPIESPLRTSRVELAMSRASLFQTEFEQYTLAGSSFFGECGEITRGRQSPLEQFVRQVPSTERRELDVAIETLAHAVDAKPAFAPPGKIAGLADPGRLSLEFAFDGEQRTITTSLDSIVNGGTRQERAVRAVVERVRSLGERKTRCGFEGFFGLR